MGKKKKTLIICPLTEHIYYILPSNFLLALLLPITQALVGMNILSYLEYC